MNRFFFHCILIYFIGYNSDYFISVYYKIQGPVDNSDIFINLDAFA